MPDERDMRDTDDMEAKQELPIDRAEREGDPMSDPEFRLSGLRHAMGFCIIATAVSFQLGVTALDLGYDRLGTEIACMSAIAIFVLMAGWRSYDLSCGKRDDMGVLFLAYKEGREVIVRATIRILALFAIAESVSTGTLVFLPIILIVALMVIEADKFVVVASWKACEEQTREDA